MTVDKGFSGFSFFWHHSCSYEGEEIDMSAKSKMQCRFQRFLKLDAGAPKKVPAQGETGFGLVELLVSILLVSASVFLIFNILLNACTSPFNLERYVQQCLCCKIIRERFILVQTVYKKK